MPGIAENLEVLRRRIAAAQTPGQSVKLIAVSKTQPVEAVEAALRAGQTCFGENRVQEAMAKFEKLKETHPEIELHLIGPLQTNKVEDAVKLFDVIETVDRFAVAVALDRAMQKTGRTPQFYVEVNSGAEPQKAGVLPEKLGEFLKACQEEYGLRISGLMCIPPQADDPVPHFKRLKQLAETFGLQHVSMGMSADFEAAIRCGATEVRVGTAVFGERKS